MSPSFFSKFRRFCCVQEPTDLITGYVDSSGNVRLDDRCDVSFLFKFFKLNNTFLYHELQLKKEVTFSKQCSAKLCMLKFMALDGSAQYVFNLFSVCDCNCLLVSAFVYVCLCDCVCHNVSCCVFMVFFAVLHHWVAQPLWTAAVKSQIHVPLNKMAGQLFHSLCLATVQIAKTLPWPANHDILCLPPEMW